FVCHSEYTSSPVPSRVQAYVETIIHTCANGGRALVSVIRWISIGRFLLLPTKHFTCPPAVSFLARQALDLRNAVVAIWIAIRIFNRDDSLVSFGASHLRGHDVSVFYGK